MGCARRFISTATTLELFIIALLLPGAVNANWMYLGIASLGASGIHDNSRCNHVPGLAWEQLKVCEQNPEAMPCVGLGVRLGITECHYQFKYERWNCTTTRNQTVFGPILAKGTRETAFIRAITSSGVVHAVTSSCSAGNLTDCSCNMAIRNEATSEGWKWGGCSDNVDYGIWFAQTFVDPPDRVIHNQRKDIKSLMNLHNNEVGRQAILKNMLMKCRCHGVSGSCAVKTCWKKMPNFREVGRILKAKYEKSVEVAHRSKRKLRRRDRVKRSVAISDSELVFAERSPNFCRRDPKKAITGTKGRECNKGSKGPDSCDLLCCGRGYNTQVIRHVARCHCKFVWCCQVKCKTCETMLDKHTCK